MKALITRKLENNLFTKNWQGIKNFKGEPSVQKQVIFTQEDWKIDIKKFVFTRKTIYNTLKNALVKNYGQLI